MKKCTWYMVALLFSFLILTGCHRRDADTVQENTTESAPGEAKQIEGLQFPYELDEGRLVVNSLFQSSIENPDCADEYADDIASLEIINKSGKFLESAEITLYMSDDTQLHMVIKDIPADKKVWVFDDQNRAFLGDTTCISMDCNAEYLDEKPMLEEQIAVKTDETIVTLTNQSGESIDGLTVACHCAINGVYYGGLTYSYSMGTLPANGSVGIEAEDCFLGTAEVVRITK